EFCKKNEINYYRIPPRPWWASDGSVPAEEGVHRFCDIMDRPENYPVLVHCFAGSHRTGAYCAVYRMEYQGWSNARAIAEMKACGYKEIDDELDLLSYLEHYRPRRLQGERAGTPAWTNAHYRAAGKAAHRGGKPGKRGPKKGAG